MTDEVKKLTIQVRPPRGTFPGEVVEGFYCVVDGSVVLTDESGKPIGADKRHLSPGEDARLVACRMVRARRRSVRPTGWDNQISYPKSKYL
jgi:hypothetical protein